jgi:two-component system sensor histidine kinase DctS
MPDAPRASPNGPLPAVRTPRRLQLYLAMPKVAIALLVLAVIGLLWLLRDSEREERRATLIADILWLEQNLRFQLTGVREHLSQLAIALPLEAEPDDYFARHARQLRKGHPELEQILWLEADLTVRQGQPAPEFPQLAQEVAGRPALRERIDVARRLARPQYTVPHADTSHGSRVDLVVPVIADGRFLGSLVAIYSLRGLLDDAVPWWFTEKYQLDLVGGDGTILASKSNIREPTEASYSLPLDEIGHGLVLRAGVLRGSANLAQRAVIAAILTLATAVFWSLWAIRRLIRRRLAAEEQLREANAFRKAMEDSLLTGLRARDLDGRLIYANPAFCRMVGYDAGELVGRPPPMPYWAPDSIEETMRMHEEVLHGKAPANGFEIRFRRKDGEHFDALVYEAPLIDGNGEHIGWMGSVLDITERKRISEFQRQQEDKLQHTARLVAMGEMASTLAHELNQPLSAIASYTTGCLNKLDSGRFTPAELADVLRKLNAQSQRAGRIIRQVHDFVRRREPRREACAVAEIVDEAVMLFEAQARKAGVRISCNLQGALPEVSADPTMLEQVMLNLLRNAVEAMADTPPERRRIEISVRRDGERIVVRVADHGPGIPSEVMSRLFTPFQTTKPEGMGMGLAICRSIIEYHHGHLDARNSASGGAEISFFLPIIAK